MYADSTRKHDPTIRNVSCSAAGTSFLLTFHLVVGARFLRVGRFLGAVSNRSAST